ncbi:MAG: polyprenol phosphomannose-dependent alpha 1,6 mannosyltransferase MptB [Pseudonocardiaceae bacterium]
MTRSSTRPDVPVPNAPWSGLALGGVSRGTLALGLVGSLAVFIGGIGCAGIPVTGPIPGDGLFAALGYGPGREVATVVLYLGLGLMVWAWIRLGRDVLAGRVAGRAVAACAGTWLVPMLFAPPLFTRDVYSYLAQGAVALHGFDPYTAGPDVLLGSVTDNVAGLWQDTGAPYGPLFLLLAKGVVAVTGDGVISGVLLMRLAMLPGLAMLGYALPGLARHLGGRSSVALWVAVANPLVLTQLVGGPHNDILMVGLLAVATLLVLDGRHGPGMTLAAAAIAVKVSAGVALPFLVLIWAARLPGGRWARIGKAAAASFAIVMTVYLAANWALGVPLTELPDLAAPLRIVDWLSAPTGVGEILHRILGRATGVDLLSFVSLARLLGLLALAALAAWQCRLARAGGVAAVRQMAVMLALTAVLSPTTLPWYFTWALALGAALPWTPWGLSLLTAGSVWLMIVDYPNGFIELSNWPYLAAGAGFATLAALSLRSDTLRRDTLRRVGRGAQAMASTAGVKGASA